MSDKIKHILTSKQLSPSQFADEIGVQRSSISHILSGRNRPSLDIVQKIVRTYPDITYEWFLNDATLDTNDNPAPAPIAPIAQSAYSNIRPTTRQGSPMSTGRSPLTAPSSAIPVWEDNTNKTIVPESTSPVPKQIDRILIFYSDGTFLEYKPA